MPTYRVTVQETYTAEVVAANEDEAMVLALEAENPDYEAQRILDVVQLPDLSS